MSFVDKVGKHGQSHVEKAGKQDQSLVEKVNSYTQNANHTIYLVTGKDSTGRPAWYYVRIPKVRELAFKVALSNGTMDISEYGEILESAYGEAPPEEIVKKYQNS